MATKDDPTLNRVFDKFFPLLHDLGALREELPQSDLDDLHYFLDTFDEWDQHPTARRMFEVEAAFREPSSVSDRDIIKRYMERVRECSLETFRLLAEHEDTEVLGTALRVFPWEKYAEQKQIVQEVLSGRGIGTSAQVSGQGDVIESKVFEGTVETESPTISETPGELSEESVDVRKEVRSPFIAGARADADWRRAAAGTPILRKVAGGESVGRIIITHRQEILETGPGLKAAIDEILVRYKETPPNDPDTTEFVERLETLSTGLDGYLAMLQNGLTEAQAQHAGKSLFKTALSAIKAFEKTTTGDKVVRLAACGAILGAAGLAAPMLAPWITVPLMTACVFPDETKVATSLFKVLGDIGRKFGILPPKSGD